jgi:hypothetical protein
MQSKGMGWVAGLVLMIATPLAMFAAGWGAAGQKAQEKDNYRLEGPFTHGNLTVFPGAWPRYDQGGDFHHLARRLWSKEK